MPEAGVKAASPYSTEEQSEQALLTCRCEAAWLNINLGTGPTFRFAEMLQYLRVIRALAEVMQSSLETETDS